MEAQAKLNKVNKALMVELLKTEALLSGFANPGKEMVLALTNTRAAISKLKAEGVN